MSAQHNVLPILDNKYSQFRPAVGNVVARQAQPCKKPFQGRLREMAGSQLKAKRKSLFDILHQRVTLFSKEALGQAKEACRSPTKRIVLLLPHSLLPRGAWQRSETSRGVFRFETAAADMADDRMWGHPYPPIWGHGGIGNPSYPHSYEMASLLLLLLGGGGGGVRGVENLCIQQHFFIYLIYRAVIFQSSETNDHGAFGWVFLGAVAIIQCIFFLFRCLFNFGKTIDHRKKLKRQKFVKLQYNVRCLFPLSLPAKIRANRALCITATAMSLPSAGLLLLSLRPLPSSRGLKWASSGAILIQSKIFAILHRLNRTVPWLERREFYLRKKTAKIWTLFSLLCVVWEKRGIKWLWKMAAMELYKPNHEKVPGIDEQKMYTVV